MNGFIFSKISPTSIRQNKNEKEYQNPSLIMGNQSMLINLKNDMWQNSVIQCANIPLIPLVFKLNEVQDQLREDTSKIENNFTLYHVDSESGRVLDVGDSLVRKIFGKFSSLPVYTERSLGRFAAPNEILELHCHAYMQYNKDGFMASFITKNAIHLKYQGEISSGMEENVNVRNMMRKLLNRDNQYQLYREELYRLWTQRQAQPPQAPAPAEPQAPPPAEPK